jgi:hypothetical protein
MTAIGVGVAFLGYAAGVWGYCLIRGYNVTGPQLFRLVWPGPAKASLQPVNLQSGSNGLQNVNLQAG